MVYLDYDPLDEYETGTYVEFPSGPVEEEEVVPTCDICNAPEDQEFNGREYNWNGETGNHIMCEENLAYEKRKADNDCAE